MLNSATNIVLFVMVAVLAAMTVFCMVFYPDSLFKDVFAVFTNILTGFAGYKYGKTMPEQNSISTQVTKDQTKTEINQPETLK